jgi:hypothetical protein
MLQLHGGEVLVTTVKPSADRRALMIRLFNPGQKSAKTVVTWSRPKGGIWLSDLFEQGTTKLTGPIEIPPMGAVTLRVAQIR